MLLINDVPVKYFKFPGGEIQVQLHEIKTERVILTWRPTSAEHIMLLALTCNALRRQGICDIELDILYLPYGRQDKVFCPGEAHSISVMCNILDTLETSLIRIWDLHNEHETHFCLGAEYLEIDCLDIFKRYNIMDDFDTNVLMICAPDLGAKTRAKSIADYYGLGSTISFEKVRDLETGKIIRLTQSEYNRDITNFPVLVVDDICDGGATFIEIGKQLKESDSGDLSLYVTHGIFSKGFDELYKYYEHIYCHHVLDDSIKSTERLTIFREFNHAP